MNRRGFLRAIIGAAIAPAIVRAEALMPIKPLRVLTQADIIDAQIRALRLSMMRSKEILMANVLSQGFVLKPTSLIVPADMADKARKLLGISNGYRYVHKEISLSIACETVRGDNEPLQNRRST